MPQKVNRWFAVVIGIIFLSFWLAGCQGPAPKGTNQQTSQTKTTSQQTSSAKTGTQGSSQPSVVQRLDPSKSDDVAQAKAFAEKLLHDIVGNEARDVVGSGHPELGGFALEVRFNVESVDKEQLNDRIRAIYREMVKQFPGHLIRLQVNPFYTAEYKNGQPVERKLVTTCMDDVYRQPPVCADKLLYTTNWDKEAYPWMCQYYDQSQVKNLPCDPQRLGSPAPP